jgi:hypothetical protein
MGKKRRLSPFLFFENCQTHGKSPANLMDAPNRDAPATNKCHVTFIGGRLINIRDHFFDFSAWFATVRCRTCRSSKTSSGWKPVPSEG